ncbi:cysteine--tRNA ligase [Candidatus Margulisiibacteriota bacterium]
MREVQVYNTFTKRKEIFEPINKNKVHFYVCGVTVYDQCHIGHARVYVVFDAIRRFLQHIGYDVKYVQNFTDIDDKIINRANELKIPISELTEKYIIEYFEDMKALNVMKADSYPKATEYVLKMQEMVKGLIEKDMAYVVNGDVWFSIHKFKNYGMLSKKVIDDLRSGFRVDINDEKKDPLDFALWKKAKPEEPSWDSPWGKGRPGWHLECSVMSLSELGESIDIHGGGEDLIFPHHENEIAQSESYTGKPFVKYWVHNAFLNIDNKKMSKSKKNFFIIKEILEKYNGEVLRFFLLKVHHRTPLAFSLDAMDEAKKALDRFHNTLKNIPDNPEKISSELKNTFEEYEARYLKALSDDFNFAEAIGVLFEMNRVINKENCGASYLQKLGRIIGLFYSLEEEKVPQEILGLVQKRVQAKKDKNYQLADDIRAQIISAGYLIEDTPEGARVKKN